MKLFRVAILSIMFFSMTSSSLFAHPGHDVPGSGFQSGLLHPLMGLDHLLAMLTVGLLSAQLGGAAMRLVPGSFLLSMVAGGILGMQGVEIPAIEYGIALSIIVLGITVALDKRFLPIIPLVAAGLFGFVHGHAHGAEMPRIDSPMLYAIGFVLATAALHLTGLLLGLSAKSTKQTTVGLRLTGAAIAAAGCWFMITV